jgi:membrane-associated phospholipid phosphatase
MKNNAPTQKKSLLHKASAVISTIGNPLITFSVFVLFITIKTMDGVSAALLSLLVIGGVAIPISINNYVKTKNGKYTNYDVSDREQRQGFYHFLLLLIGGVTGILYLTNQPAAFRHGSLVFFVMVIVSYIINYRLKVSMHTSISVYLGITLLLINFNAGLAMLVFAILIGLSRLVLKRHTVAEVVAGLIVGLLFGAANYWVQLNIG